MSFVTASPNPLNGSQLEQEISAAGYTDVKVVRDAHTNELTITGSAANDREIDDTDAATIQPIVTAHVPAPNEELERRDRVRTKISDAIVALENATGTKATWDGLTAAQRQEITRQALFAVAKLARFVLRRFDVPE